MHVWVRPRPRTHIECELRFSVSCRTSCTRGCQAALVGKDVSSGCYDRKKAIYSPGLNPIKGQKFCPGTQTGYRDELPSLSLGITKVSPLSLMLVDQPATEPVLQVSPRDTQGRLGSKKPQSRAAPREPIGDFITFSDLSSFVFCFSKNRLPQIILHYYTTLQFSRQISPLCSIINRTYI